MFAYFADIALKSGAIGELHPLRIAARLSAGSALRTSGMKFIGNPIEFFNRVLVFWGKRSTLGANLVKTPSFGRRKELLDGFV